MQRLTHRNRGKSRRTPRNTLLNSPYWRRKMDNVIQFQTRKQSTEEDPPKYLRRDGQRGSRPPIDPDCSPGAALGRIQVVPPGSLRSRVSDALRMRSTIAITGCRKSNSLPTQALARNNLKANHGADFRLGAMFSSLKIRLTMPSATQPLADLHRNKSRRGNALAQY